MTIRICFVFSFAALFIDSSSAKSEPNIMFNVSLSKGWFKQGTVEYDVITVNRGGNYDPATGIFTVPSNGAYNFRVYACSDKADTLVALIKNINTVTFGVTKEENNNYFCLKLVSEQIELEQGDEMLVAAYGGK